MITMSYSRWKDLDCPYLFKAKYIDRRWKEPENEAMKVGSEIHECIAEYYRHCFTEGIQSDVSFLQQYKFDPKNNPERCRELIDRFAESEWAIVQVDSPWVKIEQKVELDAEAVFLVMGPEWSFHPAAGFRGIVDLAYRDQGDLVIVDWKTGFGDGDELQLKLYAYMLWLAFCADAQRKRILDNPVKRIVTVFAELATGKKHVLEWDIADVLWVKEDIMQRIKEANSLTEFEARVCGQCRWCSLPDCPIKQQTEQAIVEHDIQKPPIVSIPTEIESREDAEKAMMFLMFAEGITGKVEGLLRSYVETNGPVSCGGKVAEVRPNEPWKAGNVEKIVNTMVALQVPKNVIWDNLSLSESSVEKILKKSKKTEKLPVILSLGERKQYKPKFGLFNDSISR